MKRFLFLLACAIALLLNQSNAQTSPWITQNSGLAAAPWHDVRLAAVSNTVCWGLHFRSGSQYTRTTDGGVVWTAGTIPGAPPSWRGSAISAIDASTAWVLMHDPSSPTSGGVFKTTDGGASWAPQPSAFPGTGGVPRIIHFFDANVGLCVGDPNGGNWEIYRTTNGGSVWIRVDSSAIPAPIPAEITFALGSSSGNSFGFSGGDGDFSFWRLYRTTDRGITWTVRSPGGGTRFPTFASTTHGIAAGWLPSKQMRRTTDGGDIWSTEDMSFLPFTPLLFGYVPGTVGSYVLTNGVREGFSSSAGCAYTTNGGDTWNNVDLGVSRGLASFASPTVGWAPGDNGVVYKWTGDLLAPPIPTAHLKLWLKSDAGVVRSGASVSQWTDQSGQGNHTIQPTTGRQPIFVDSVVNNRPIIRFDGIDDKLGFTGTAPMSQVSLFMVVKNDIGSGNSVLVFGAPNNFNLGEQLFIIMRGLDDLPDRIGIGFAPTSGIRAYGTNIAAHGEWRIISILINQTIWNTTLRWNGQNATMVPIGSDAPLLSPMGDSTGSGGGLGGADGVPAGTVTARCDFAEVIVYDTVLSDLQRTAIGQYLAQRYDTIGVSVGPPDEIVQGFRLEQNYPNPFNPNTRIGFKVQGSGFVSLKVYDVLGREVRTLVNENLQAGGYEVTFDATGMSSGVYLYRMQAGEFTQTKKLLLLR